MEKAVLDLYQILQKLIGHHRQLLDIVRLEREALVEANLKSVQDITHKKQGLIEIINQVELARIKCMSQFATRYRKPLKDLSLSAMIVNIQGEDPKSAEQLRGALNALSVLVQRISDQNRGIRKFLEQSLSHIQEMKQNVLGETHRKASTYTAQGQHTHMGKGARLISREI